MIRQKDYLVTAEQLFFAVTSDLTESDKYLCMLRYARQDDGKIIKFDTHSANGFLAKHWPQYLFYSEQLDVHLHAVDESAIQMVLHPTEIVNRFIKSEQLDGKCSEASELIIHLLDQGIDQKRLGITGSVMLGFHGPESDIDFVVYGLQEFMRVRNIIRNLVTDYPEYQLDAGMWKSTYDRRNCDLKPEEFIKHETRKYNKLKWRETKVDFSCVPETVAATPEKYPVVKLPATTIRARIINDKNIFSFPARYVIDHPDIAEIVTYTATYTGQAFIGEYVEACGPVERDHAGIQRLIIGTSREARGEYLKVPGL